MALIHERAAIQKTAVRWMHHGCKSFCSVMAVCRALCQCICQTDGLGVHPVLPIRVFAGGVIIVMTIMGLYQRYKKYIGREIA